jgi:ribosomal protein S19E (S16A)
MPGQEAERSPTPALRSFDFFTLRCSGLPRSLFAESQQTVEWMRQGWDGDVEWGQSKREGQVRRRYRSIRRSRPIRS